MTFGITPQGFNRKLESDIIAEIVAEIAPLFGVDPSTVDWPGTDEPLSQVIRPFSRQAGLIWELIEACFEGNDPAQAFGTLLDAMLAMNNISRLEATATQVTAVISGVQGAVVPAGTRLSVVGSAALFQAVADASITKANLLRFNVQVSNVSSTGTQYSVTINGHVILSGAISGSPTRDTIAHQLLEALNASSLVNTKIQAVYYGSAVVQVASVSSLASYSVTVNGTLCAYTSDASATSQEIVDGLVAAINAGQSNVVAVGLSSSTFSLAHRVSGSDWAMTISLRLSISSLTPTAAFAVKAADLKTVFSGDVDSRMAIDKLFSPQAYAAVATGAVQAPSGTLSVIETPVTGFTAASNFLDGILGQDVESDDEARIRREETLATGSSQVDAILTALNKITGVSVARVYQNLTDTVDSEGRPGHSCEALVVGGTDLAVAQTVWITRAAGIPPYGNINADGTVDPDGSGTGITIKDSNDASQIVHFSRPEPVYAFMTCVKTLYSEEDFPATGNEAIRQALLTFGNSLGIGKDFLIQRFIGPAVSVPGVGSVVLQIAVSTDPDDPSPTYGTANIAVSPRQVLVFDTSRITVS